LAGTRSLAVADCDRRRRRGRQIIARFLARLATWSASDPPRPLSGQGKRSTSVEKRRTAARRQHATSRTRGAPDRRGHPGLRRAGQDQTKARLSQIILCTWMAKAGTLSRPGLQTTERSISRSNWPSSACKGSQRRSEGGCRCPVDLRCRRRSRCQLYARARVMGSYPEIVAKPNICVTEMPSNAVAVLLRSGRDQPSSWARWTFRRETGSAAYPAPPS